MASSLFVKANDTFEVTVHYKEKDGVVKILEKEEKGAESITVTCRKPDFETSQVILHASTIFTENGQPVVDMLRIRKCMLYHLAMKWNAKDERDNPVPLLPENISSLNPHIAATLCSDIEKSLGNPIGMFLA